MKKFCEFSRNTQKIQLTLKKNVATNKKRTKVKSRYDRISKKFIKTFARVKKHQKVRDYCPYTGK